MIDKTLYSIRRLIPSRIFNFFSPAYHWLLSYYSAYHYHFPSRNIKVIAVTGTKGKSSTVEILNTILEEAGYKTALSNTIRYKIGDNSVQNLSKMSTPGRFFLQKLISDSVKAGCQYVILEMTSQGALLYRHRFIELDTLIFTNLTPEHIEAHGSYENYRASKLAIAENMLRSRKTLRTIIVNADDKESDLFLSYPVDRKLSFSIHDAEPYTLKDDGIAFSLDGRQVISHLQGAFNLYNIMAAVSCAKNENVSTHEIITAIESLETIPGRVEKIAGKNFTVVVDYAHTADSLQKIYEVFKASRIIGVLGGTGGGRDTRKRKEMGKIADKYCAEIILTNEDPYDEDPDKIVADVAEGITNHQANIIMDRRLAIRKALELAQPGDFVIITGKGTDPFIMGANGTKLPWSDSVIVREELARI
jgi:UDP-N-acetylmuramoyl-L-alanyl-D-glutamate--2,6-diaminopimelate ligase